MKNWEQELEKRFKENPMTYTVHAIGTNHYITVEAKNVPHAKMIFKKLKGDFSNLQIKQVQHANKI